MTCGGFNLTLIENRVTLMQYLLRYGIVVDFVRKESAGDIKWRDAVIVVKDGAQFAIDDVVTTQTEGLPSAPFFLRFPIPEAFAICVRTPPAIASVGG